MANRRLVTVVMDGIGESKSRFGNAVKQALTPNLDYLRQEGLFRTIFAHGTYVGLPADSDLGNSEVGHNAIGAGRILDQGAKLVSNALESGALFKGSAWQEIKARHFNRSNTLHFLGLLSDGNVHSHEAHLYKLMEQAAADGIQKIRVHVMFDGRDVGEKTAELYVSRLESVMDRLNSKGVDVKAASAGGRMIITMDRYNADWSMVERGWNLHVKGEGPRYSSLSNALASLRRQTDVGDQYLPGVVIGDQSGPFGQIRSGDSVVLFNFRGDRAIEISRAFTETEFHEFNRGPIDDIYFAGAMQYDGDLHIPANFLVSPPEFKGTFGEHLSHLGVRQFACSETQKFGHVTYFWNGNRSGYFDQSLEEYLEIPSDCIPFDLKPWMKAHEIAEATIQRMATRSFDFARINFANGDMVGHTGNFEASVIAVAVVDQMIGRLIKAAKAHDVILMVTADHGNADEMFDAKAKDFPENWLELPLNKRPTPKTSHTTSPVPLYIFDPRGAQNWRLKNFENAGLANLANTGIVLLGEKPSFDYFDSLVESK